MFKKLITTAVCLSSICFSAASSASVIGVFGDYSSSVSSLVTNLQNMGHTVTNLGGNATQDLSSFESVWGASAYTALSTAEQSNLSSFLSLGGGLYLTGERPCCETLNASLTTFANSVVIGAGIQIGGLGDQGSSATINTSVLGNLASTPNSVTSWLPSASGGMSGVSGDNVFATSDSTSTVVAGAWDMSDLVNNSGRLVVMMDVNWLTSSQFDLLENIESYLAGAQQANTNTPNDVPAPTAIVLLSMGIFALGLKRKK